MDTLEKLIICYLVMRKIPKEDVLLARVAFKDAEDAVACVKQDESNESKK